MFVPKKKQIKLLGVFVICHFYEYDMYPYIWKYLRRTEEKGKEMSERTSILM